MIFLVNNKRDKVLEFFIKNPLREVHLRELSRLLRLSFPWARKIVSELSKEGIILRRRERGLVLAKAHRDDELFRALKRSYNLFSLYKTGLVQKLNETYVRPEAILLFGSFGRGEDTENSDIDLAILTSRTCSVDLSEFERKLGRRIRILELTRSQVEREFLNTLANGIVLSGFLEVA